MNYQEPLSDKAVAISISESDDLAVLGLAEEHLRDAMTEISRHLLAMGAQLVYGGDLRDNGYTALLFELVMRHRRDADEGDPKPSIINYLSWPVHSMKSDEYLVGLTEDLEGIGQLRCLARDGSELAGDRLAPEQKTEEFTDDDWAASLTSMREVQTAFIDARVVLGGRVTKFKGRMPGIAEEALFALKARQPLFLLGGFGGCARDIARTMNVLPNNGETIDWPGGEEFILWKASDMNNGLEPEEIVALARTVHVDQAVALILRGLLRLNQQGSVSG
jgi:hypothetical protein